MRLSISSRVSPCRGPDCCVWEEVRVDFLVPDEVLSCVLVFGTARKAKSEPQSPPVMCAIVEMLEADGERISRAMKTERTRRNEKGMLLFEIVLIEAKTMSIKAIPLAPSREEDKKQAFITPVTAAVTVIIKAVIAEPYFSSMSGPKSSINVRFPSR